MLGGEFFQLGLPCLFFTWLKLGKQDTNNDSAVQHENNLPFSIGVDIYTSIKDSIQYWITAVLGCINLNMSQAGIYKSLIVIKYY